jgi:hypothetical protein
VSGVVAATCILVVAGLVAPVYVASARASERAPAASAASDFNCDGYGDLAVGAPLEDVGPLNLTDAGAVNVLYGTSNGLSSASNQFWTQDSPNVEDVAEVDDYFGGALATGDFNGDGCSDLAIGAQFEEVHGIGGAGSVSVLYGSPAGLSATVVPDQFWTQDSSNVEDLADRQRGCPQRSCPISSGPRPAPMWRTPRRRATASARPSSPRTSGMRPRTIWPSGWERVWGPSPTRARSMC